MSASWIRRPIDTEAIESPCGRFVLTGLSGGAFGPYSLRDRKENQSYRSRTLEGVRSDIRDLLEWEQKMEIENG